MSSSLTSPRKIILNVVATYARSLLSFVLGLFTVRWILEALGHSDYGLYGVVGSVMIFISMLNSTQSATVARYYAFAIGLGSKDGVLRNPHHDELRALFNTAISIHLVLPIVLIGIGYPIGIYAFHHWLNVPDGRMEACVFVFRCSLASLFCSTITAPCTAMFIAHQLIRQLVLFSLVNVFGLVAIAYSLLHISGDRLKIYALMMLAINLVVCLLHIYFARRQFPSCRIVVAEMFDAMRIKDVLRYTGIKFLGDIAWCGRNMGNSFVTNIYFGTLGNAAFGIAGQLSMQAESLCATLNNAFAPAITTEEGAGRRMEMVKMAFRSCKFGSVMLLLLTVPLLIKMDYWLKVWLKNPPEGAGLLCSCLIFSSTITYLTKGHQLAIQAHGRIGKWQLFDSIGYLSGIPIACILAFCGCGIVSIGCAHIASMILVSLFRLVFARIIVGASIHEWIKVVLLPLCMVWGGSFVAATFVSKSLSNDMIGLCGVVMTSSMLALSLSWMVVFTPTERNYLINQVRRRIGIWKN